MWRNRFETKGSVFPLKDRLCERSNRTWRKTSGLRSPRKGGSSWPAAVGTPGAVNKPNQPTQAQNISCRLVQHRKTSTGMKLLPGVEAGEKMFNAGRSLRTRAATLSIDWGKSADITNSDRLTEANPSWKRSDHWENKFHQQTVFSILLWRNIHRSHQPPSGWTASPAHRPTSAITSLTLRMHRGRTVKSSTTTMDSETIVD